MAATKLNIKEAIGLIHKVLTIPKVRRRTASSKKRLEISGGGKKPWKQKGTGNARAGSIRSSIWVGGNKAFGPKPKVIKKKINKKEKELAVLYALLLKNNKFLLLFKKGLSSSNFLIDFLKADNIKDDFSINKADNIKDEFSINFQKKDFYSFFIILVVTESEFAIINKKIKPKNVKITVITKLNIYWVLKSKFIFFSYNASRLLKKKEYERLKRKYFRLDM